MVARVDAALLDLARTTRRQQDGASAAGASCDGVRGGGGVAGEEGKERTMAVETVVVGLNPKQFDRWGPLRVPQAAVLNVALRSCDSDTAVTARHGAYRREFNALYVGIHAVVPERPKTNRR